MADMERQGWASPVLHEKDLYQVRKIVRAWVDLLYSFSGEAGCSGVRTIQSGVDEYSILPGRPVENDKTLLNFIKAFSGIAMNNDIETEALVQRPKKGLSPIARIKKGDHFGCWNFTWY